MVLADGMLRLPKSMDTTHSQTCLLSVHCNPLTFLLYLIIPCYLQYPMLFTISHLQVRTGGEEESYTKITISNLRPQMLELLQDEGKKCERQEIKGWPEE